MTAAKSPAPGRHCRVCKEPKYPAEMHCPKLACCDWCALCYAKRKRQVQP
jgi:hypothetical protein